MELLRTVRLSPYGKGKGPVFTLKMWDMNRRDHMGKQVLGYRLTEGTKPIFEGQDFACSPFFAVDSDSAVASLLSFLTLRPGDTDAEYFEGYSPAQLAFTEQHAELLSAYVLERFEGTVR